MEKSKVNEKSVIKRKEAIIIMVGGATMCVIAYKMHIRNIRREAFRKGIATGFQSTMDWFDTNFDNLNLRGLWNVWSKANPGKVKSV